MTQKQVVELAEEYCEFSDMKLKGEDAVIFWIDSLFKDWEIVKKKKQHIGFGIVEEFDYVTATDCEDICYSLEIYNEEGWAIRPEFAINQILNNQFENLPKDWSDKLVVV